MKKSIPDSTAVRVALWRALHMEIDSKPHILEDKIGLKLAAPDENWRKRPDMHPQGTSGYRAGIVARARLIEDLMSEKYKEGLTQYVILGAGLDTFAQRETEFASKLRIFEIDQPETQSWKKNRLMELGYGTHEYLKFVPVDFEAGESWLEKLKSNGFDSNQPAVISSTGVSMYLTKEANFKSLKEIATFAPGSTLALTFILNLDLIDPLERAQHEMVYQRAAAAGTPFVSFFSPNEIMELASKAGFRKVSHISRADIIKRYFMDRPDGLIPASGEEFLIAEI